ncbi:MAG: HAMP domain-containing protein [Candidatus Lambdaproteobacteria bacterium]|nr:HAMP domain-containing protein [Candidatus Lambdaproteobacteria bacterium]
MKYRFRDKLVLAFALLLLATVVPVLVLVNTQIGTISERKIVQDLRTTRGVFERLQQNLLGSASERATSFILTQPEIRAEIATSGSDTEALFGGVFGKRGPGEPLAAGPNDADPFAPARPVPAPAADPFAPAASAARPFGTAPDPFGARTPPPRPGPEATPAARARPAAPAAAPAAGRPAAGRQDEIPERQNRLLSVMEDVSLYRESQVFFLTDARGEVIFSKAHPARFGGQLAALPEAAQALRGRETFAWWGSNEQRLAGLHLLPETGARPVLYQMFLKPVVFADEVKGLIGTGAAVADQDLATITGITRSQVAFVAHGVAYRNSLPEVPGQTLVALSQQAERQPPDTLLRFERAGEEFLALAVPVLDNAQGLEGHVIVYRSQTREREVFDDLKRILNVIGIVALVLAGLLAYGISHGVSGVVRELAHGVQEVRQGNLEFRLDVRSRDEFGDLGSAFNEMTAGLKEKEQIRETFKRYVSSSVVDELLRNVDQIRLGGENRNLTIQFSDIAGFTSISEALPPEGVVEFLNEYLSAMTAEIEAEQGIVDKYIGDAVMAFWGTPVALDNHALHACRAALRQLARLRELREQWAGRGRLARFDARFGLHTGDVVVGNIGSSTRMDYTIIGDSVNTASRLEGMNKEYGTHILISEATWRRVEGGFCARELDAIVPVGRTDPLCIYELVGDVDAATPELRARHRRFAEALALYRARRFAEAGEAFHTLDAAGGDPPSRTFEARCRELLRQPPPPDWNGTYVPTHK